MEKGSCIMIPGCLWEEGRCCISIQTEGSNKGDFALMEKLKPSVLVLTAFSVYTRA
jgi:hypothetical protein